MIINLLNVVTTVCFSVGSLIVGAVAGYFVFNFFASKKLNKSKNTALKIIEDAYAEAKTIKKEASIEAKEEAQKLLVEATKKIDQAYSKGVLKLNTISRKKSNLAKKFNAMA